MTHDTPHKSIDWKAQWAEFAMGFDGQVAHIPVGMTEMILKPGAGFGDCSHPTTRLMLAMMADWVKDKVVLDVGCGSGVLSVAAGLLGARRVYGIDIDPQAIEHAQQNAFLNHVQDRVCFSSGFDGREVDVVLMNMIWSEQRLAWEFVKEIRAATLFTSGVLSSEATAYKEWICQQGKWSFKSEREEEGWLGMFFIAVGMSPLLEL